MEINAENQGRVVVIHVIGDIDGSNASEFREQVSSHIKPESKILLDMSGVEYMSSAGLRVLLATYRDVTDKKGKISLSGLTHMIRDTMSMTGFLNFFSTCDTIEDGILTLESQ